MEDRSASLWHNRSAPLVPPRRPVLFSFNATNRTLSWDLNDTAGGGARHCGGFSGLYEMVVSSCNLGPKLTGSVYIER